MAQKSAYVATTRKKDKRAIALNIMKELHNLQPPGRFLIEDVTRRDGTLGSILSKNWVEVSNDKAIEKIMHSLREKKVKVKVATSRSLGSRDGNTNINKNEEEKEDFISNLDDDCVNNVDLIRDDLLQQLYSLGGRRRRRRRVS